MYLWRVEYLAGERMIGLDGNPTGDVNWTEKQCATITTRGGVDSIMERLRSEIVGTETEIEDDELQHELGGKGWRVVGMDFVGFTRLQEVDFWE